MRIERISNHGVVIHLTRDLGALVLWRWCLVLWQSRWLA